jgi:2,6-dihydroxypseudooxynicotine hydrolase
VGTPSVTTEEREYVAPTYLLTSVPDFVESITYRMLADGMILQDIRASREEVADWAAWGPFWSARALAHESHAAASLESGYRLTAAQHLIRASLCAHYGQFLYFAFPEVKQALAELKSRLYLRAAPLMSPVAERVEIDFDGHKIPGYLRTPNGAGPHACVIQIGGLDAAKEDAHQFGALCLDRGLATFAFDGPGQGELFYRGVLMTGDYPRWVSAVIDYLSERKELDRERFGVIGRSTGGFLAPQAAASDSRIKGCVSWGAMYDLIDFDSMPPLIKDGFQFVTRTANWQKAGEAMSFVNLRGIAERVKCPLYVLHGGKDNITPPWNAERLISEAGGPTELALYPDSIHCNHDVAHVARPAMADWLAKQLKAES